MGNFQALDPRNWARSSPQDMVNITPEGPIDPADMEKLDDGHATTSPYCPRPCPEIPADLEMGMYGIASSPPANQGSSPVPQDTEAQESMSRVGKSLSEQLPPLDACHPGHSKDVSADLPTPAGSKRPQTPSDGIISDSHYDSSEAFDPTQLARLALANKRLIEEQQTVSAKRSQVRELRQALKYQREEESNLRAALMKKLNALFSQQDLSTTQTQPLMREYEVLQVTIEAYLDLETRYHDAEDQLEQQEYRLGKSMERFASLSYNGPFHIPSDPIKYAVYDDLPDDHDDSTSIASTAQDHPQAVVEYLSRVGDVRLLQEHLLDLDSQWLAIIDKQKQQKSLQLLLDDESLEFLRTYDDERRKLWYDLNHAQLDAHQLRSICEENGLLTDEHVRNLDFLYPMSPESSTRQSDEPLKLSVDEDSSFFFEPQTTAQLSPTRFINQWILHQLRNSSVEIHRLKPRPELQALWDRDFDDTSITRWALREWFSDDAGRSSRPLSTSPPDEKHTLTSETVVFPEKKSNPVLSKSRSVPFLRRASVVPRVRHSYSMSFHSR